MPNLQHPPGPEGMAAATRSAAELMPTDTATRSLLQARAAALAIVTATDSDAGEREQYLCVRLGPTERYGIPYLHLDEIMHISHLARVPCTPAHIAGVVNRCGGLLTVLDLHAFFRTAATHDADEARIVVVRAAGVSVGLLVDAIEGNELYAPWEVAPPLKSDGVSNMDYVRGIYAGDVTMLNITAILEDPAISVKRHGS